MAKRGNKKRGGFLRFLRTLLLLAMVAATCFVLFMAAKLLDLDSWQEFDAKNILDAQQTLLLYDGDGNEVTRLHGKENRVYVPLSEIPAHVRAAFISAEDARFYEHPGVDLVRIAGAAWADIKAGGYVQGASTISQQLVKLSHLTSEKTMSRKLEEAVLACQMETKYSKDEILEMYLNYVYFGGGFYGVEAAALGYFGVHVQELSVAQAAMLAGILKSPSKYAPHLNMDASVSRRNLVLREMEEYGYIDDTLRLAAQAETATIIHDGSPADKRGFYVDTAMAQAASLLGVESEELLTGGYRIYTVMDADLQAYCEQVFAQDALFPGDAQGAIAVQEVGTGFIRALVGGRSYDAAMTFNRATGIRRQPGSVIKPIIAYAPALEYKGYTAASMLLDEPTQFADYSPHNFGNKYYGWVTLREAVTRSLNVPAVKVLSDIGVRTGKAFAQACGIPFDEQDTSLTLALGGFTYGVSPWQIVGAYAAFAGGGVYNTPTVISKITDSAGTVLYAYQPEQKRVLSEQNAYILTSMLQSAIQEGTGHRLGELNIPLAGKTGTVGDAGSNRDAWMACYNSEYAAAVWVGYDNSGEGTLPQGATGGYYPALILGDVYKHIYAGREAGAVTMPAGVNTYKLDIRTLAQSHEAVLTNAFTPREAILEEVFAEGTEPTRQSTYWAVPLPPAAFSAALGAGGKPVIYFTTRESFANYQLFRTEGAGTQATLIKEWEGNVGKVEFIDESAQGGHTYTYYVVPVHKELRVGDRRIQGPATRNYTLTLPPAVIDIEIPAPAQ
ncbi:MAG: PBP1A family penicillin-binding protein [Christensenellaceae bacterium]|jgi:1A family penicillin-binding protein|nr:PBP1A family penicillin-binding protein [Christensenellaceae bacterium]